MAVLPQGIDSTPTAKQRTHLMERGGVSSPAVIYLPLAASRPQRAEAICSVREKSSFSASSGVDPHLSLSVPARRLGVFREGPSCAEAVLGRA